MTKMRLLFRKIRRKTHEVLNLHRNQILTLVIIYFCLGLIFCLVYVNLFIINNRLFTIKKDYIKNLKKI